MGKFDIQIVQSPGTADSIKSLLFFLLRMNAPQSVIAEKMQALDPTGVIVDTAIQELKTAGLVEDVPASKDPVLESGPVIDPAQGPV